MDLEDSPVNHVALALDTMDISTADDFKLTEKESKQQISSAVNSDTSIGCLCLFTLNLGTYVKMFHGKGSRPLHSNLWYKPVIKLSISSNDQHYRPWESQMPSNQSQPVPSTVQSNQLFHDL